MNENNLKHSIDIANIHLNRIHMAMNFLQPLYPLTAEKVKNFQEKELLYTELLINRFGKLQDMLGAKIINYFLDLSLELNTNSSMIDKINYLERIQIIDHAYLWQEMRNVRNRVAHEYPDQLELSAKYLNEIIELTPKLIQFFENIKNKINQYSNL